MSSTFKRNPNGLKQVTSSPLDPACLAHADHHPWTAECYGSWLNFVKPIAQRDRIGAKTWDQYNAAAEARMMKTLLAGMW